MKTSIAVISLIATTLVFAPALLAEDSARPSTPEAQALQALSMDPPESRLETLWPEDPKTNRTVKVDCDRGQDLERALRRRAATIVFEGVCVEDVRIERDSLTLRGEEGAEIQGTVEVVRSHGITLEGFTVRGGAGISIQDGSVVDVTGISSFESTSNGMTITSSTVRLTDSMSNDNTAFGVRAEQGTVLELAGAIVTNGNGFWGVFANGNTQLVGSGFSLEADNNLAGFGLQISSGIQFTSVTIQANNNQSAGFVSQLNSATSLVASTVNLEGNQGAGMILASFSTFVEGFNTINILNNGDNGVAMGENSTWVNFFGTGSTLNISGHPGFGLRADANAVVDLRGPSSQVSVTNSGAAGVTLINSSGRFENLTATGNAEGDLVLDVGSRGIIFEGFTIDSILCGVGGLLDLNAGDFGQPLEGEPMLCDPNDPVVKSKMSKLRSRTTGPLTQAIR